MIHRIRHSDVPQLFWGLMAALLLNLSVDAPDFLPRHVAEDLAHNEQESIAEWVVEKLLGYEQAFPEYDDDDQDERSSDLTVKLEATLPARLAWEPHPPVDLRTAVPYPPYAFLLATRTRDVLAPPPRG